MGVTWGIQRFDDEPGEADLERYSAFSKAIGGAWFKVPGPTRLHAFEHHWDFAVSPPAGEVVVDAQDRPDLLQALAGLRGLAGGGSSGTREQWDRICDGGEVFCRDFQGVELFEQPLLGRYRRGENIQALAASAADAFEQTGEPFFDDVAEAAALAAKLGLILTVDY